MTYKEKLIELLKTDEEVKIDLEELRFGCRQYMNDELMTYIGENGNWDWYYDGENCQNLGYKNYDEDGEIIGNPLEERHLRMYCENINLRLNILTSGDIIAIEYYNGENKLLKEQGYYYTGASYILEIAKLDNKKDFDMQEDFVYEKIYNFLANSI